MSKTIVINARLQFPCIDTLDRYDKYGATLLFAPGSDAHDLVQKTITELIKESFGGTALPADNICLKDGDSKPYDGYKGMLFISASRKEDNPFKPSQLVGRNKKPADASAFYAGCHVNAAINIWPQNNKWGKKVNAELIGLQFVEDDDQLMTGKKADISDDTFPDLPPLETDAIAADDFI